MTVSVCPLAYLKNNASKLHEIFCTYYPGRGSVLLWRMCHMLCTSGFVNDVMFPIRRQAKAMAIGPILSDSPGGSTQAKCDVYDCLVVAWDPPQKSSRDAFLRESAPQDCPMPARVTWHFFPSPQESRPPYPRAGLQPLYKPYSDCSRLIIYKSATLQPALWATYDLDLTAWSGIRDNV